MGEADKTQQTGFTVSNLCQKYLKDYFTIIILLGMYHPSQCLGTKSKTLPTLPTLLGTGL